MNGKLRLVPDCARAICPQSEFETIGQLDNAVRVAFIQGLRRRAWTIEHAARKCKASPSAVVKWISGKRRIPGSALFVVLGLAAANDNREAA